MDPEGVGETPVRTGQRLQCSSDSRIYCVVNTTTANLLGEFDSIAEAQGFLRDLGDYADNIVVEVLDE